MKSSVNINEFVWVRLTPAGVEAFRADIEKFPLVEDRTVEQIMDSRDAGDGLSRFQLYELMDIFGPYLYNGALSNMFVENTIYFTRPR